MGFWEEILGQLEAGQRLYLLTVIAHQGSTPGRTGFKMLIAENGFTAGSIGGGMMEFRLLEEAKGLLKGAEQSVFYKQVVPHIGEALVAGSIDSGEQTIAFVPLDSSHVPAVKAVVAALEAQESCGIELSEKGFQFIDFTFLADLNAKFKIDIVRADYWTYRERLDHKDSLYIVGGGHVSVPLSDLFASMGFYVTVLDNRASLKTLERNKSAHEKEVIDFNEVAKYIPEGDDIYVTVMTHKFSDDQLVLSKLIAKDLKYLGVLGSQAKIKTLRESLTKNGFSDGELAKVFGPLGLQIKSRTPLEIAVSIAAEVIAVRNGVVLSRTSG